MALVYNVAVGSLARAAHQLACRHASSGHYDVAVVGGGIVGLATAREAAVRGASVVLLERETAVASGASSGNSGLGCTGYDSPVGSLERQLLRRSIQLRPAIHRSLGLSDEHHVRKAGSLVVAWTEEQSNELPTVLKDNIDAGDTEAVMLTRDELLEVAGPGLSSAALGAVLCPGEAVVEPWLIPLGYAESAALHGADILLGRNVVAAEFDDDSHRWKLTTNSSDVASTGRSPPGNVVFDDGGNDDAASAVDAAAEVGSVTATVVINCAGLYGDSVERFRLDGAHNGSVTTASTSSSDPGEEGRSAPPWFTVTPRKGQFLVYAAPETQTMGDASDANNNSSGNSELPMHIIEPVATQFTKGVIVWVNLHGNIVVGPTATDQPSKTDRSTDVETVAMLKKWGEKVIPALEGSEILGTYSGLRPATEHRDYQIVSHPEQNWVTVAGIRSTGLTASSGIAEYVAGLYEPMLLPPQKAEGVGQGQKGQTHRIVKSTQWISGQEQDADWLLGVTEASENPEPLDPRVAVENAAIPPLELLAAEYQTRGDGIVTVFNKEWRVAHPIASFGFESRSL